MDIIIYASRVLHDFRETEVQVLITLRAVEFSEFPGVLPICSEVVRTTSRHETGRKSEFIITLSITTLQQADGVQVTKDSGVQIFLEHADPLETTLHVRNTITLNRSQEEEKKSVSLSAQINQRPPFRKLSRKYHSTCPPTCRTSDTQHVCVSAAIRI